MPHAWAQVDMIAAEALRLLQDNLMLIGMVARDRTSDFNTTPNGYKVGDTVRIATRPVYEAKEFIDIIEKQPIRSSTRSLTIEKLFDVSVGVTAREKALFIDDFSQEVIFPAVVALAEAAETYVATKLLQGAGLYTSSTLLDSAADVAQARKVANVQQLSPAGRFAIVDSSLEAKLLGQTWFNQACTRGDPGVSTLQSGNMGRVMGIDWASSLYFPTSAHAANTGTAVTDNGLNGNTNNQTGNTTLTIDGAAAGFNAGDRIQVAGMRRPLIVKTTVAVAATTIEIVDPITEIVPDNAAVTVIGSGKAMTYQGAILDTDAIAIAMPLLDPPSDKPSYVISADGLSIRVVQGYDMDTKVETMSLDFLIGAAANDPRRITLLASHPA